MKLSTNLLAYAKSIQTSEATFHGALASDPDKAIPVPVTTKTVRGQISNYEKPGKNFKFEDANIQTIDYAAIPDGCDRLRIHFTLRVLPCSLSPIMVNDPEVGNELRRLAEGYRNRNGYVFLARRYLWNIANARWAWRNLTMCDSPVVRIEADEDRVSFDAAKIPTAAYPGADSMKTAILGDGSDAFDRIVRAFADALTGEGAPFVARVTFEGRIAAGMEVYPSQEFVRSEEKSKDVKGRVGRVLSSAHRPDGSRQATFHSQKVGAAIRSIDEWHRSPVYGRIAVPVNPYAGVIESGMALRHPSKERGSAPDLYRLLSNGDALIDCAETAQPFDDMDDDAGDLHFVIANLIRGGVFGIKEAGKNEKAGEE